MNRSGQAMRSLCSKTRCENTKGVSVKARKWFCGVSRYFAQKDFPPCLEAEAYCEHGKNSTATQPGLFPNKSMKLENRVIGDMI